MMVKSLMKIAFCLAFPLVFASPGWAQTSPTPPANASDLRKLSFIEERLDAGRRHADYWQKGWTGFYGLTLVAQGILGFTEDTNDDRVVNLVGAVKSGGGLAYMLLKPLPGRQGADPLRALPSDPPEPRIQLGEECLQQGAERALERTGWKRHLIVIGANLVAGGVIWWAGDEDDALISTLTGIAVGEANIWTQPSQPAADLEDYRNRFGSPLGAAPQPGTSWRHRGEPCSGSGFSHSRSRCQHKIKK